MSQHPLTKPDILANRQTQQMIQPSHNIEDNRPRLICGGDIVMACHRPFADRQILGTKTDKIVMK